MKTWFITGISSGIGLELARAAIAAGDAVVGTTRNKTPDIEAPPSQLHILTLDVADKQACRDVVAQAFGVAPRIDVIVNNAGSGLIGAIEEASDAEVAKVFDVNFFGPLAIIQAALPYLRKQRGGHILNITSIGARAPGVGSNIYSAAKFALEGLSIGLAQEVKSLGIQVTAVAPGIFRTDFMTSESLLKSQAEGIYVDTVDRARALFDRFIGSQPGDPRLAAEAIIRMIYDAEPPLQFLLGSDAFDRTHHQMMATLEEMQRWEELTRSTDYIREPI